MNKFHKCSNNSFSLLFILIIRHCEEIIYNYWCNPLLHPVNQECATKMVHNIILSFVGIACQTPVIRALYRRTLWNEVAERNRYVAVGDLQQPLQVTWYTRPFYQWTITKIYHTRPHIRKPLVMEKKVIKSNSMFRVSRTPLALRFASAVFTLKLYGVINLKTCQEISPKWLILRVFRFSIYEEIK